ncbi:relaxase/mobilization nuclease domain-containing protein [Legionella tunisiensis]|uniref:relaxase/mobilization nuclease domain-containing protein n=1 Tax=Legionella tunisiensis TaxID=1034944 RepID=UPI0012EAAAC5|nr:relaxase/mobilization nuclease domain-containing protein [Legionella tunisiensis]
MPLETQDKTLLLTREESMELLASWQASCFDSRSNSRDTVHYVFSAPPGTERGQFKTVTREFLSEEYEGEHDYLFVEHDDTEHPHIHAVVCMRSIQGKKLDPRKKYLHAMRKRFAETCRDNGIMLASSRRFERGLSGKSSKSELVQMRQKRQHLPEVDKRFVARVKTEIESSFSSNDLSADSRLKRHQFVRSQFYDSAKKLYDNYINTEESKRQDKDIQAAKLLLDYAKSFPQEKSRTDFLKEKLVEQSIDVSGSNPVSRMPERLFSAKEQDCDPDLT